ncbi:hypothetical protein OC845_006549 [Tilletia horrida]|nr:hypothetical protein OC845_006549 [Tilletia horrida]
MKQGVEQLDQLLNVIEKGVADAKVNCDLIDRMDTAIQASMTTIGAQTRTLKAAQDQLVTDLVSMLQRTWTEPEKASNVALTELLEEMDQFRDKLLGIAHQRGEVKEDGAKMAEVLTSMKKAITQAPKKRHHGLGSFLTGVSSQLQEFDRETTSSVVNVNPDRRGDEQGRSQTRQRCEGSLSMFQTQVIARIQEERRMLDVERTQLNEVQAQERMRAKAAQDGFVANVQQAAQQYTQANL